MTGARDAASEPQPRVACVILTWNQREKTLRCLESVRALEGPAPALVIWDNGSEDETEVAVRSRFPEVVYERHPRNLGVASGRNGGAELAMRSVQPEFLLFLDNDIVVEAGYLRALLAPLLANPRVGQAQSKLRFLADRGRLNDGGGCRIRWWIGETAPVGFGELDQGQRDREASCIACGGSMLVRATLFRELGGFDERFDPIGPEDLDFSLRLQQAGFEARYVPAAVAYHEVSHSFGGGAYTEAYARHKARNWFLFLMRHARLHQKLAFFAIGAPFLVTRAIAREARRGNLGALRGIARGLLEFVRRRTGAMS